MLECFTRGIVAVWYRVFVILLAVSCAWEFEAKQVDITPGFCQALPKETINCQMPQEPGRLLKFRRTIYCLWQELLYFFASIRFTLIAYLTRGLLTVWSRVFAILRGVYYFRDLLSYEGRRCKLIDPFGKLYNLGLHVECF
jgi:hypothetical protein